MQQSPSRLVIPQALWQQITAHVQNCFPEEGCGLLGGAFSALGEGRVETVLPVENALHSPVRFAMDPEAQIKALMALEEQGKALLAIFHSHPNGPQAPSPTDLAEFGYPGVLALILFPALPGEGAAWLARAYNIDSIYDPNASAREVPLAVEIPM